MKFLDKDNVEAALVVCKDGSLVLVDGDGNEHTLETIINKNSLGDQSAGISKSELMLLLHTMCHEDAFRDSVCVLMRDRFPHTKKIRH